MRGGGVSGRDLRERTQSELATKAREENIDVKVAEQLKC
jgi:hypothetical protein